MLNIIDSPKGIDVSIRKFQEALHSSLLEKWTDISSSAYQSYARCYRNKKDKGYIAEVFTNGKDYKEVYWNDKLAAISFFGISDNIKVDVGNTANVHLVFFVDLKKLKPTLANRADEEVRLDVLNAASMIGFGFELLSVDLWLENVLKEYPGSYRDERLKTVDMQPVHCFRLNFKVNYNKKQTFCS